MKRKKNENPVTKNRNAMRDFAAGISRRDFARRVGWTAAAAVFPGSLLPATGATLGAKSQEPELSKLPPEGRVDVEDKLRTILNRYPGRFQTEQVTELRRILTQIERMLIRVRAFPLQNGDPSANVLKLYSGQVPERQSPSPSRSARGRRPHEQGGGKGRR